MLIDRPAEAAQLHASAQSALQRLDAGALVLDVSAGWSAWRLSGDAAPEAFARLSAIPLTNGFSQGAVAGVPARVLASGITEEARRRHFRTNGAERDSVEIVVLTASTLRHHVGRRVRESCADLDAVERPARELGESARP
jgi:hypothetical protein